jgi:hypothetical protein
MVAAHRRYGTSDKKATARRAGTGGVKR